MRVGLIAPCIGVGGGDGLMLGLIRYAHNVTFTGMAIHDPIKPKQYSDWTRGITVPIHQKVGQGDIKDIHYHANFAIAVREACKGADIILSWAVPYIREYIEGLDIPIIEYAQNCDLHAKHVVASNIISGDYFAACSKTAATTIPDGFQKHILYNGIDPGRVTPRYGGAIQRQVWGFSPETKILLYMGRFVEEKHPSAVIQALLHLPENWVGIFAGFGPQDNHLKAQAQNFVPKRAFFIDHQYHVGDILAASDVFILPSDFEGHSLALLEAWLAGIPTVYTDFDAALEMEEAFGPLGTRVPKCSDSKTYAEAVLKASSQSDEVLAMAGNAKNVVWDNFTLSTISAKWEDFFEACIIDWRRKKRYVGIRSVLPMTPELTANGNPSNSPETPRCI